MKNRWLIKKAAAKVYTVFFLLLTICFSVKTAYPTTVEPIKIGAIFSKTGIAAAHNRPLIEMAEFSVHIVNKNGGVLGRKLEMIVIDNKSTPIGSALAAQKAIELGVSAVIGAQWSSHSLVIAKILQEAGIPMITPGSTNSEVTKDKDYIFRVCFLDSFQGKAMARFARNSLNAKRAVIIRNIDEKYSITLSQYFLEEFEALQGKVLGQLGYRGSATDFSNIIDLLDAGKPDVVYLPGYTRDSGLLIKQAKNMGIDTTFLGGDAWDEIASISGEAINGSYQSAAWHPDVSYGPSLELKKRFKRYFGEPLNNTSSPLAYDAVMLLKEAISNCQCTNTKELRDSIAATSGFQGATGEVTFDENGDPIGKEVFIIAFDESKPVFVKTVTP